MTPTPVLPSLPDLTPEIECAALSAWNLSKYGTSAEDTVHPMFLAAFKAGFQDARRAIESLSRAPAEQADPNLVKEFRATGLTGAEAVAAARGLAGLQDTHPTESAGPAPAGMLLVSEAALRQIARAIEGLKRECGMDPESPQAIRNAQYMSLAYAVRKLGESHE